jgi:cytochrome c553
MDPGRPERVIELMHLVSRLVRPLAVGLAAAMFCAGLARGERLPLAERIAQCAGCHGEDGNSRLENIPSLAGQPAFFVLNQLFLMREGVRPIEAMLPFVKDLKDDDITALAEHFAALTPKPSDEKIDPALVKRGAELAPSLRCTSCHLPSLAGQQQMPRLAKQRVDYLTYAMKAFRDDTRSGADTLMSNVVIGLSDADLAALAHWAASH